MNTDKVRIKVVCGYRFYFKSGVPKSMPCFWYESEHPLQSGHAFEPVKEASHE